MEVIIAPRSLPFPHLIAATIPETLPSDPSNLGLSYAVVRALEIPEGKIQRQILLQSLNGKITEHLPLSEEMQELYLLLQDACSIYINRNWSGEKVVTMMTAEDLALAAGDVPMPDLTKF
jgi:hypothetical protein